MSGTVAPESGPVNPRKAGNRRMQGYLLAVELLGAAGPFEAGARGSGVENSGRLATTACDEKTCKKKLAKSRFILYSLAWSAMGVLCLESVRFRHRSVPDPAV
jgi:hypothetical protein